MGPNLGFCYLLGLTFLLWKFVPQPLKFDLAPHNCSAFSILFFGNFNLNGVFPDFFRKLLKKFMSFYRIFFWWTSWFFTKSLKKITLNNIFIHRMDKRNSLKEMERRFLYFDFRCLFSSIQTKFMHILCLMCLWNWSNPLFCILYFLSLSRIGIVGKKLILFKTKIYNWNRENFN